MASFIELCIPVTSFVFVFLVSHILVTIDNVSVYEHCTMTLKQPPGHHGHTGQSQMFAIITTFLTNVPVYPLSGDGDGAWCCLDTHGWSPGLLCHRPESPLATPDWRLIKKVEGFGSRSGKTSEKIIVENCGEVQ